MDKGRPHGTCLKQTVLIVEHDQIQRELVSVIFEESDMHVIACMSAEAAAAVLEKVGKDLTLMFTDDDLEGEMSGVDLAKIAVERFSRSRRHRHVRRGPRRGRSRECPLHAETMAAA